jgi:hypothetical protein
MSTLKYSLAAVLLVMIMGCGEKKAGETTETAKAAGLPSGEVVYEAPKEWIPEPPNNPMRKSQFKLPGAGGAEAAELMVFYFPGAGGSVEANLDRWYGQFLQPDGSETKSKVVSKKVEANGLPVTVVYVTGTYKKPKNPMMMGGPVDEVAGYALKAAIVETADGPWFFKTVGPQQTIDHWNAAFDEFVKTFKVKS